MDFPCIPDIVPELLWFRAQRTPAGLAFHTRSADGTWRSRTWAEHWDEVERMAGAWHARGLRPGDRLAIMLPTCRAWEVAQQAGLVNGSVVVGLDPRASSDEVGSVLKHAEADWLVVPGRHLAALPAAPLERLKRVIVVGDWESDGTPNREAWSDCLADAPAAGVGQSLVQQRRPDELATIIYTSGTTGAPKGIAVTQRQLLVACRAIAETFPEIAGDDTTLGWLPMATLFQRMVNLLAIARGVQTYFVEDPRRILESLQEIRPSFCVGVPRFYEKLHETLQQLPRAASAAWRHSMKFMISGSAPLAGSVLQGLQAQGLLVLEAYGLTENVVPMSMNRVGDYRLGSVGKPLPQNEIRIDADGEILVRGPGLFTGYYHESRPAERFTDGGYYRTGDCGYLDEDGFLYLTGRKAEFIKTSTGRRISPVGIEAVYGQSPYVDQVVVWGEGAKYLVALLTCDWPRIEGYLTQLGAPAAREDPRATSLIKDLLLREVDRLGARLAPHERVQAVGILSSPLLAQRGELTMAAKLRRAVIETHYRGLLDSLCRMPPHSVLAAWESPPPHSE